MFYRLAPPPAKAGICIELVKACQGRIPVLGICLGHQAIAVAYAELAGEAAQHTVTRAPYPAHGVSADIHHTNHPLFAGIPSPFAAARYHSLAIAHMPKTLTLSRTHKMALTWPWVTRRRKFTGFNSTPKAF